MSCADTSSGSADTKDGPAARCDDRRARSDPQGFHRVIDYHACIVFAVGMAAIGACLALHAFFMFLVLEAQMAFRRRYPQASGAGPCLRGLP